MIKIINGDSIKELKKFPDNYFHSAVLDPPYGLSFMGKKWDYNVPSVELWTEVLRVLKEGGYLLSFSGTRTQHRMAVNIEDAGFEIRDMIAWVYGSGFPKSHNIGKAVDKLNGNEREITETYIEVNKTKGNSQWEGWGTALKPALEPITMARKPFKGTVANNVLKNGVGGININECRVETKENLNGGAYKEDSANVAFKSWGYKPKVNIEKYEQPIGRFPANFIHDGSDEVKDLFPNSKSGKATGYNFEKTNNNNNTNIITNIKSGVHFGDKGSASRFFYCAKASKQDRNEGLEDFDEKRSMVTNFQKESVPYRIENGIKTNPKAITHHKNNHPTVKPTDLMRYLVRLVTPKDGIVLDCFMGSGSTGKACDLEGFNFVGIDLDKDYCEIAKARIDKAIEDKRIMESQMKLF